MYKTEPDSYKENPIKEYLLEGASEVQEVELLLQNKQHLDRLIIDGRGLVGCHGRDKMNVSDVLVLWVGRRPESSVTLDGGDGSWDQIRTRLIEMAMMKLVVGLGSRRCFVP